MMTPTPTSYPSPLCLCPPNPVYRDQLPPPLLQHPAFLSRPLTLTTDDESTIHFSVTFQIQAACCVLSRSASCLPPVLYPPLWNFNMSAGQGRHSIHISSSSFQFKEEVWELSLEQRTHNWHPSCLIKGESSGMDPLSHILAFIRIVCKQNHTQRQLTALFIAVLWLSSSQLK